MAILLRGKTKCAICGEIIEIDDDVAMFGPMTADPMDPVALFSDAAMHMRCFDTHPLRDLVTERWEAIAGADEG